MSGPTRWWRHVGLAGTVAGLLLSTGIELPPAWVPLAAATVTGLALARPRGDGDRPATAGAWLGLVAALGVAVGAGVGGLRVAAIEGGAAAGPTDGPVSVEGVVTAAAKGGPGEWRFPLDTADGRLVVVAPGRAEAPATGERLRIKGTLAEPEDWQRANAARLGAQLELTAWKVTGLPGGRAGLSGFLDRARGRAERALEAGMDPPEAALGRGFVLGQDDRIDAMTRERFRRSGLAHLLAVSGQNVLLLAVLGGVLLGAIGIGSRARLVLILALIALYVPIAGAGASIQRAAVMGGAGILAALAGRPADRIYLPLLAAAATLTLNPLAAGDVGWQLSFAAVLGISLWAPPLRDLLRPGLERRGVSSRLAAPIAEGVALTVAATLATAPLMGHHFESFSLASLPANVAVLPAVAPVMWLGMLAAFAGQLPMLPAEPLGWVAGPLISYIDAVAELLARPSWSLVALPTGNVASLLGSYAVLLTGMAAALAALRRRAGLRVPVTPRRLLAGSLAALALLWAGGGGPWGEGTEGPGSRTLRLSMLDVGQGDAVLLSQAGRDPVLVDTGPPGGGVGEELRELGVSRLGAVFLTHDQSDHSGALDDVVAQAPPERLLVARPAPTAEAIARRAGAEVVRVGEGSSLESGPLRLTVLAPASAPTPPGSDPNADSLVMAARFGGWSALLPGDAEAEARRIDPGPLDVLKLAHHGSADAGLEALLDRSAPRIALIGVGADNRYGHPTEETLASLAERGVCVLRTDRDGTIHVDLGPGALTLTTERDPDRSRPGCGTGE